MFQQLHYHRKVRTRRFTDQQMKVLRHDDVAHDRELVIASHLLQFLKEQIAGFGGVEQRPPLVATAGDEVEIATAV